MTINIDAKTWTRNPAQVSGGRFYSDVDKVPASGVSHGASVTLTGSGFGTRAVTPLHFQKFESLAQGATKAAAGYAATADPSGASTYVDLNDGIYSGAGCLLHDTGLQTTEAFPHIRKAGVSETQIYSRFYIKAVRTDGSNAGAKQIKGPRAGYGTAYSGSPVWMLSFYPSGDLTTFSYTNASYRNSSAVESGNDDFSSSPAYKAGWRGGDWNLVEVWQKLNDVGQSSGFERIWINGLPVSEGLNYLENQNVRQNADHVFQWVYLMPGITNASNERFTIKFADHYIHNTPARVVFANSATLSAATETHIQDVTAWSDTSVSFNARLPAWANHGDTLHAHVVTPSGTSQYKGEFTAEVV